MFALPPALPVCAQALAAVARTRSQGAEIRAVARRNIIFC
jgi:hypothetical protein